MLVFVEEGETLTIEPGTVIKGKPGQGADASALIVARGAKIFAEGTADAPIIFTAEEDNVNDPEDFGQTLAVWGVESGPYVYIPVLGPSTLRDAPARAVDFFFNPVNAIDDSSTRHALRGTDLVQIRAQLLQAEGLISGEPYYFIRDAYQQRREYLINDGDIEADYDDDFDAEFDF